MCLYAPTEDFEVDNDQFYQIMETAHDALPNDNIKMVTGDLNARLGEEDTYRGVTGNQSLHLETNNNGQR
jgi:hypothetical protein